MALSVSFMNVNFNFKKELKNYFSTQYYYYLYKHSTLIYMQYKVKVYVLQIKFKH